jgi:putative ABC transport system permease protein
VTKPKRSHLLSLAARRLDRPGQEHLLGDITEEFERLRRVKPLRARAWLLRQLLGVVLYRVTRPPSRRAAPRMHHAWETWFQDIRLGMRLVRRNLLTTATVVATLGLGIGSTTTMFTIARGILRELPFENAHEIVSIGIRDVTRGAEEGVTPRDFTAWSRSQSTMVDIAAVRREAFQVTPPGGPPLRVRGASLSPGSFALLGIEPALGRDFTAADLEAGDPPVILGHRLWRDGFGSAGDVLGRAVRVNGFVRTVIGVMPEGFGFPRSEQLWVPLDTRIDEAGVAAFVVFGRVSPGSNREDAQNQFAVLGSLAPDGARRPAGEARVYVEPFRYQFVGSDAPLLLYTLLAIVSTVLLIACANVINVLLAQASARRREIGVRAALGGTRGRLVRQLLSETLVLAALGGVGGAAAAAAAIAWFNAAVGHRLDIFWVSVTIDGAVLAFGLALTATATLAAGLAPALQASKIDVVSAVKEGAGGVTARGATRVTRALVVAEIALSCVLLVASGLMVRGVAGLSRRELRFDTGDVMTARVELPAFDYADDDALRTWYRGFADRWSATEPGNVTLSSRPPGQQIGRWTFAVEGARYDRPADYPAASMRIVSDAFFEMFGAAVVDGRRLDARDRPDGVPVALVNTAFADRFFDGAAVGRRIRMGDMTSTNPWREIVGVIDDRGVTLEEGRAAPGIFIPLAQRSARDLWLAARHPTGPADALTAIRETVAAVDPNLPVFEAASLDALLSDEITPQRTFAILFGALGIGALVLAAVGLYGTLAFSVRLRRREIGLRQALGAGARQVLTHVLRAAAIQLAAGLAIGLAAAVFVAPLVGEFTFGADPRDPLVFLVVAVSLTVTALVASLIPAGKAARMHPMQVLREE